MPKNKQHESRLKLLDAAMFVIRSKGYTATTVDDICAQAKVTKGSFFHHFKSKEELALATAEHFSLMAEGLFSEATYRKLADPLDRILGYVDFRIMILDGELPEFTCLLGTMVQEAYQTHPAIQDACDRYISEHALTLADDINQARDKYLPKATFNGESLAYYIQASIQGALILAKAKKGPGIARTCLGFLREHLAQMFCKSDKGRS